MHNYAPASQTRYRADIDGLRAVAVLGVLVFHVAQSYLRGGFVGVDIFFVISGYLITGYIERQISRGQFSLLIFYQNRVRRIFPALFAMLIFCSVVAIIKFMPYELHYFGLSLISEDVSASNIYFWQATNYFSQSSEQLPLLHTWSLSVEEQFYLVFPLLMILTSRSPRRNSIILAISISSFAISAVSTFGHPIGTFYLLPTRTWELLIGALLALGLVPSLRNAFQRNSASAAGLLMILVSMLLYSPDTPFPGAAALLPCLGAALIIHAGASGSPYVSRLLSLSPLVFVGLISYSLYLWHWPLLAFQRTVLLLTDSQSKVYVRLLIVCASFVCATLSWLFIERPTRNKALFPINRLLAIFTGGFATLVLASMTFVISDGLPWRLSPAAQRVARYHEFDEAGQFRSGQCFLMALDDFSRFDKDTCAAVRPNRPTIVLLGDSHAASLFRGLERVFPDANVIQVTGERCAPLIISQPHPGKSCGQLVKFAVDLLRTTHGPKTAILVARWNRNEAGTSSGWNAEWLSNLLETTVRLKKTGSRVLIVGPMVEYLVPLPRILADSLQRNDFSTIDRLRSQSSFQLDAAMATFARKNDLDYFSVVDALCKNSSCVTYADKNAPVTFDTSHLTEAGSLLIASKIAGVLATPKAEARNQ